MLGWIIHSRRPLMTNELATAVALTDNRANFSPTFDSTHLPVDISADIRSLFGPLVRLEGGGITFSDGAVRNEFRGLIANEERIETPAKRPLRSKIPGNVDITGILAGYLSWEEFAIPVKESFSEWPGRAYEAKLPRGELFNLVAYAVQFLPSHYKACTNVDLESFPQIHKLIQLWPSLKFALNRTQCPQHLCVADLSLLAAQLGLTMIAKTLGKTIMGTCRETAVSLASWGGHLDTVHELLTGACADHTGRVDTSGALEFAATRGHDDIINYLVTYMTETAPQSLPPLFDRLLCKASMLGYEKQVSKWVTLGANVNAAPEKITPLQHACRMGHTSIARYLLRVKGADANSNAVSKGDKPLLLAADGGYELIVRDLLAAGADTTCLTNDETERTPLFLAAMRGHKGIVQRLLDAENTECSVLNHRSSSGNTPLMVAFKKGNYEIANLLLEAHASATIRNSNGNSALYFAIDHGANENLAIKTLAQARSVQDIDQLFLEAVELGWERFISYYWASITHDEKAKLMEYSDKSGKRPLHFAAKYGHTEIAKLFLQCGADIDAKATDSTTTPLGLAAMAGQAKMVELLLEHNANAHKPYAREADGSSGDRTLLHDLAEQSEDSSMHARVVSILLEKTDIDPNRIDEQGNTALSLAVSLDKFEITKAILQHPTVDPNITGPWSGNALHILGYLGVDRETKKSTKKIARLLTNAGIDPLKVNADGLLPIHIAIKHANVPLLEVLLEDSPECLEARTRSKKTPLAYAVDYEFTNVHDYRNSADITTTFHIEVVKCLLKHKPNGDTRDLQARTPLMTAAIHGIPIYVRMLLEYGCDRGLVDKDGRTALHLLRGGAKNNIIRDLLRQHIELLTIRDKTNLSALHLFIRNGNEDKADLLLREFYPDVEETIRLGDLCAQMTKDGETPLISAARRSQYTTVRLLLKLGAETEHRAKSGDTALPP